VPPPYNDPRLLVQIVKVVMECMAGFTAQRTPITQVTRSTLGIVATTDNVVLLVRLVKSMREMGCQPYIGEQDAERAGRWIKKVEKTMIHINIPKDLQVNYTT
jgi:hypothetical protein